MICGVGVKKEDDEVVFLREERKGCRDDPIELDDDDDDHPVPIPDVCSNATNTTSTDHTIIDVDSVSPGRRYDQMTANIPSAGASMTTPDVFQADIKRVLKVEPQYTQPLASPKPELPADKTPILSSEQRHIFDRILEGNNVLVHGSAGTGESVIIRAVRAAFEERYMKIQKESLSHRGPDYRPPPPGAVPTEPFKLAITAPTGLAAM